MSKSHSPENRLRLCQILGGNEEGGLENHVLSLCNHFCAQYEVSLVAHPKYADRLDARVNFIPLPMDSGRRNPLLLGRLWWQLRQLDADLLHAHGNKAAALLARVRRGLRGRCIATVHSLKKKVWMFERMDGVIGVSQGVLEPVQHPQAQVIYNGVTPWQGESHNSATLKQQWQLPLDKPLCVAVGRLVPVKAYDRLIDAWAEQSAGLAIIGEGDLAAELQAQIDRLQLNDRVKLVGFRDDVAKILPAADLLAISSEREGFSLVMVEALLAGTPLVSTRVPGCREVLPQSCLADCDSTEQLTERLQRALQQPDWLAEAYAPVFQMAREQLTTEAMLARTQTYYQQVLAGDAQV
ncbi:MAG: glycosyltransferase [Porticoccaceae bacterium]|nr:glycosyltransferase [Porticoccaceae bacterium]